MVPRLGYTAPVSGTARVPVVLTLILAATSLAAAQDRTFRVEDRRTATGFGERIAVVGDLDGDGFRDVLVGAAGYDSSRVLYNNGKVDGLSGRDGATLFTLSGSGSNDNFGDSIAELNDLDGDGVDDFLVVAPGFTFGQVTVYSGATRNVIHALVGTSADWISVASRAGDVDGDGIDDFAVTAGERKVSLYSGATGSSIRELTSPDPYHWSFGRAIAAAGDVNRDGIEDLIVAAPEWTSWNPSSVPYASGGGKVYVFSGADGSVLHGIAYGSGYYACWWYGGQGAPEFGFSVDGVGDVDGDGFDDFIVGAPWSCEPSRTYGYWYYNSNVDRGEATVFSGKTGQVLDHYDISRSFFCNFGETVAGVGDANGDGRPDFAIGDSGGWPFPDSPGSAELYSGLDGRMLYRFNDETGYGFGTGIAGRDVDSDGTSDVLVGGGFHGACAEFDIAPISLEASPNEYYFVYYHPDLTLTVGRGPPGNLVLIVLVSVDGSPVFSPLLGSTFGANGNRTATFSVPLQGSFPPIEIELQAFALDVVGRLVISNRERFDFY